eukprot:18530-Heterococcus_DN1.PRE.7
MPTMHYTSKDKVIVLTSGVRYNVPGTVLGPTTGPCKNRASCITPTICSSADAGIVTATAAADVALSGESPIQCSQCDAVLHTGKLRSTIAATATAAATAAVATVVVL